MGFFKTPPPPPPRKKLKKAKGPKFLTKKLKEKERYDVLAELFEDVDLNALKKRNEEIVEEKVRKPLDKREERSDDIDIHNDAETRE